MPKKYITGFPKTQAQMAEWQKKYKFETATGKWYDPSVAPTPPTPTPPSTVPTGAAAIGKQVRIGGTLYPSQEWYDVNILGKGKAVAPTPTDTQAEIQRKLAEAKAALEQKQTLLGQAKELGYETGEDIRFGEREEVLPKVTPFDFETLLGGEEVSVTSEGARRARIEKAVTEKFGEVEIPAKAALPTYEADFLALRSEKGMGALETRMTDIDGEIRALEDQTREDLRDEEGELKPISLIGISQQKIIRDRQEQIDALNRSKSVLVSEYNTKANIINQTMQFKQMDFAAATADYNASFNRAIQIQNLIEGRISKEQQIENQQRDDARANLTVITKAMTDAGKTWDDLDISFQTQISKLEMQAELPNGVTQAFYNQYPGEEVVYEKTGKDDAGREFVSFISRDKDGNYSVKNVYTGGVGKKEGIEIKFSSDDIGRLVATGLSTTEITNIQKDLNEYGIGEVKEGLTPEQSKALDDILSGVTPAQVRKEKEEEEKYDFSFLRTSVREALKRDYKKSVDDFLLAMRTNFTDLTKSQLDILRKLYEDEQKIVKGLGHDARKFYFK